MHNLTKSSEQMAENDTEIEVRTLTGESIKVSISSNRTIGELKLLLKQIFPPANSSSNFHLFLKVFVYIQFNFNRYVSLL